MWRCAGHRLDQWGDGVRAARRDGGVSFFKYASRKRIRLEWQSSGSTRAFGLKVFYTDTFRFPLGEGHHFPIQKYRLARERLLQSPIADQLSFCLPDAATDQQLLLVHTREYLLKVIEGRLSPREQRRIGFPWSPEMVERHRRSTGATLAAAREAIIEGAGVHLAGGTHHAFADRGEGFCVFNDVAVAVRVLQSEGKIQRVLIIDLDVHQGNGTAEIFADDENVMIPWIKNPAISTSSCQTAQVEMFI